MKTLTITSLIIIKGEDKKGKHEKHPDTGDTHMYPGDSIPGGESETEGE